jgi:hypothetical protein
MVAKVVLWGRGVGLRKEAPASRERVKVYR